MLKFLRKIFSNFLQSTQTQKSTSIPSLPRPHDKQEGTKFTSNDFSSSYFEDRAESTNSYFDLLVKIQEAIRAKNYHEAVKHAKASLTLIPQFVRATKKEYGSFDISTIPAIEVCGTLMAILGDRDGIEEIRRTIKGIPALINWKEIADYHKEDADIVKEIIGIVGKHPGVLQNQIKDMTTIKNGQRIANLLSWLDKAGIINRQREKKTYKLFLVEKSNETSLEVQQKPCPKSHRTDNRTLSIKGINITKLPYVPLPRAPSSWDINKKQRAGYDSKSAQNLFSLDDGADWIIGEVEKLTQDQRPDTAFRKIYPVNAGILMIDDLGNAEEFQRYKAAILKYDNHGELVAKRGLDYGIYRIGINPLSNGIIMMSKDCILHAYDKELNIILETPLTEAPEIKNAIKRFEINNEELKNHIRCVAISQDNQRYLFTVVDEVWCINLDGHALWGARLPIQSEWTKVSTPRNEFGSSKEIEDALRFMGLSYPLTTEEIKQRFRQLLKECHPDLNPHDHRATERTRMLITAAETLTGTDISSLSGMEEVSYVREKFKIESTIEGVGTITMSVALHGSERQAADWIYAANFAGLTNQVYIAGYSGRIVAIDKNGNAFLAYDIGTVPSRIADTGEYLYFLTGTRLYTLSGQKLYSIIDVYNEGDLVIGQNGFELLGKNHLKCFKKDGFYLGTINSKNPIRRVYSSPKGTVIESRQHRVTVEGLSIG